MVLLRLLAQGGGVVTSRAKRKGDGYEREVSDALCDAGVPFYAIGKQAGMGNGEAADLGVDIHGKTYRAECKRRAGGFKQQYGWLQAADILIARADRQPSLVTLRLDTFLEIIRSIANDSDR